MKDADLKRIAARMTGTSRTAGKIEFVKDQGPMRRDIRVQGFTWDPEVHRNLAKTLWAIDRAHSYGMAALRLFSKMNSSDFSPDGLLGGRGYIQKVKDLRSSLSQAVEVLSTFADTMHDEVGADHWHAAMAQDPTTQDIVSEAGAANPEAYVQESFQQEVPSAEEGLDAYENPEPDDFNPFVEGEESDDEGEGEEWWSSGEQGAQQAAVAAASGGEEVPLPGPKSGVPTESGVQEEGVTPVEMLMNTTGEAPRGNYAAAIERLVQREPRLAAFRRSGDAVRIADSSVDPGSLPGPRIMHLDPHSSPEPMGGWSDGEAVPSDDPSFEGFFEVDQIYQGEDANSDGVTGYSDPTDGDVTTFKASSVDDMASRVAASYSWLPGSRNEKLMPYYDPNASADDVAWMMANDAPDPPASMAPKVHKPPSDPLWDAAREMRAHLPSD